MDWPEHYQSESSSEEDDDNDEDYDHTTQIQLERFNDRDAFRFNQRSLEREVQDLGNRAAPPARSRRRAREEDDDAAPRGAPLNSPVVGPDGMSDDDEVDALQTTSPDDQGSSAPELAYFQRYMTLRDLSDAEMNNVIVRVNAAMTSNTPHTPPPAPQPPTDEERADFNRNVGDTLKKSCTENGQIISTLRQYQAKSVNEFAQHVTKDGPGAFIADGMGAGKTLQAICMMATALKDNNNHAVVIAPRVVIAQWVQTLNKLTRFGVKVFGRFARDVTITNTDDCVGNMDVTNDNARVHVMTPTRFVNWMSAVTDPNDPLLACISVVVIDEAHKFKTKDQLAHLRKFFAWGMKKIPIALSGTPYENNMAEFAGVMSTARMAHGLFFTNKTASAVLDTLQTHYFRTESSPPTHKERIYLDYDPTPEEMATLVVDLFTSNQSILERVGWERPSIKAMWNLFRHNNFPANFNFNMSVQDEDLKHMMSDLQHHYTPVHSLWESSRTGSKVAHTVALIKTILSVDADAKIVVYTMRHDTSDTIMTLLDNLGIERVRVDARDTPATNLDTFRTHVGGMVLIFSSQLGVGVELVEANHVIHSERWWNPFLEDQNTARVWRNGQTKKVYEWVVRSNWSFDHAIEKLHIVKRSAANEVTNMKQDVRSLAVVRRKMMNTISEQRATVAEMAWELVTENMNQVCAILRAPHRPKFDELAHLLETLNLGGITFRKIDIVVHRDLLADAPRNSRPLGGAGPSGAGPSGAGPSSAEPSGAGPSSAGPSGPSAAIAPLPPPGAALLNAARASGASELTIRVLEAIVNIKYVTLKLDSPPQPRSGSLSPEQQREFLFTYLKNAFATSEKPQEMIIDGTYHIQPILFQLGDGGDNDKLVKIVVDAMMLASATYKYGHAIDTPPKMFTSSIGEGKRADFIRIAVEAIEFWKVSSLRAFLKTRNEAQPDTGLRTEALPGRTFNTVWVVALNLEAATRHANQTNEDFKDAAIYYALTDTSGATRSNFMTLPADVKQRYREQAASYADMNLRNAVAVYRNNLRKFVNSNISPSSTARAARQLAQNIQRLIPRTELEPGEVLDW